ncbi:MAG TPA: class I SAM-dependent methyltransferase [Candidatus Limnocylindrales bacterium]|nr:class I SAM-dependent methyltransferase [Candidatus Limnocylindrales bacterium]
MTYAAVMARLRRSYDRAAEERDAMEPQPWKLAERQRFYELVRVAGGTTLLDIGAGTGVHAEFFKDRGMSVVCTDLSPRLVERCRQKGLIAYVMDFRQLDFPEALFDAVYAMNCLLHVPRSDLQTVLLAIGRVLRPGGLFYWGQYGGRDEEGVREDDRYVPKRFFASLSNEAIEREAGKQFEIADFHAIPLGPDGFVYQSLTLRAPVSVQR